jgi:hypothetical protein
MLDPVEQVVEQALIKAGIPYARERENPAGLDFYLTEQKLYIEVKRFHTPRAVEQMSRVPEAILIQGLEAAKWFAEMLHA